jgi:predicted RNA-binding protein with PUA domain
MLAGGVIFEKREKENFLNVLYKMSEKLCEKCNVLPARYCFGCSLPSLPTTFTSQIITYTCQKCELKMSVPYCKRCGDDIKEILKDYTCPLCDDDEEIK